ncbi:hypothetical protein ANTRET_LOCUS3955 [Anthophora retusa]
MNSRVCGVLISFWLHSLFYLATCVAEERYPVPKGFFGYRTVSMLQKYCTCKESYSCSCCQSVVILYTKAEKDLCINFTYQRNGLNVDVTLNSDIVRARIITDYKPFKFCTNIPGCYFSSACINVLELNGFPRSITVCLRVDIISKKRLWQLNYDCVSVSTELSTMPTNGTMQMMNGTKEMGGMSTTMKAAMTSAMSTNQMTMTTATTTTTTMAMTMPMTMATTMTTTMPTTMTTTMMMTAVETEGTTTPRDVEVLTEAGSDTTTVVDID